MSDVFQEVDEDLRRQEVEEIWAKYGPWAVGVAVVGIAIASAYMYWQDQKETALGDASDVLLGGIEQVLEGENESAVTTFTDLAADAPGGYQTMALFQLAAAQRLDGHLIEAVQTYDLLAADNNLDAAYRDLARLYAGYAAAESPLMGFDEIEARLGSVATGTGPWRYHALEVLAFVSFNGGDLDGAREYYRQITDDGQASQQVAARANEMLNMVEAAASPSAE